MGGQVHRINNRKWDGLRALPIIVRKSSDAFSFSRPSSKNVYDVLCDRICQSAIVNTDRMNAYLKVLKELQMASHNRFDASSHKGLGHVNALHSSVKDFLH